MEKLKLKSNAMVVFEIPPMRTLTDRQLDSRIRKLESLKGRISELKALEKEAKALEAEIITGIGADASTVTVTTRNYEVTNTVFERSSIDTTRLKAEMPEIAAEYKKVTTSHRFTFKARG